MESYINISLLFREKYQGVGAPKDVEEAKFDAVVAAEVNLLEILSNNRLTLD